MLNRASDECMDQGRAKVTPGDLKSVLADFNLEFLCDGLDIKGRISVCYRF